MKIRYVHSANPDVEKIHDTVKAYRGCIGFLRSVGAKPSQEDFDEHELALFKNDFQNGKILSYSVIQEGDMT